VTETREDKVARFGCGALIGVAIVVGTLLGNGFYELMRLQLERPMLAWAFGLGFPIGLGALSVAIGWSLPQKLASWLFKMR
jgi:hypothetical protein